jgi:DNA (cytosine-5)-methyltransferase 1
MSELRGKSHRKPRLLDLFCCAGGAGAGYAAAGFEVVGVDLASQPRYPFEFHQADALTFPLDGFDAIHASPPCQWASALRHLWPDRDHANLIPQTRERLIASGLPYVIENVPQAAPALHQPAMLCGSSFGLDLRRHRLFECHGFALMVPPCAHGWQAPRFEVHDRRAKTLSTVISVAGHATPPTRLKSVISVHGSSGGKGGVEEWRRAMGIDWMTRDELAQAIPPAYTEHIGHYLMATVRERAAAAA